MPPEKDSSVYGFATPIPTYDEAVAGTSRSAFEAEWAPMDDNDPHAREGQSLLPSSSRHGPSSGAGGSRRPDGYRPPTVETDDEDSLFGSEIDSDSDADEEAAQVRREMQEMEIMDAEHDSDRSRNLSSIWGKRIGFSLSLPQWRWTWRWRLPRLRIRLGEDRGGGEDGGGGAAGGRSNNDASGGREGSRLWRRCPSAPSFNRSSSLIIFARMIAIVLVLGFLYLLFLSDLFTGMARRMGTQMFDPESVRVHVQSMVDPSRIREKLQTFTNYAHVAGSEGDYVLAKGIKNDFIQYGLEDVTVDEYYVYLNYPRKDGRTVEIMGPDDKSTWTAQLEEPDLGYETAGNQTLVFHAHSKSGDVKGPLIYANYGTRDDFQALKDNGVDTKGAIALVRRRGGAHDDLGPKVKAAELAGFAGCLTYSDPADEGFSVGDSGDRGLPEDAVQRSSVSLTGWVLGDPLTPGWESKDELPRLDPPSRSPALVGIPSLPLAWKDARPLLQSIQGFGQLVPDGWVGGVPDVEEWWMGNLSSPIVHLKNEQDEVKDQSVLNIYGRIVGIEQGQKSIIIGNHRDSLAFGAASPHSGTAIMLEVIRVFGDLVARGWRPLRTIEFMSWDGAEYNLIGSTEFVEKNTGALMDDALAYINLDAAVSGDSFHASGSPVFNKLVLQVLNRVSDPNANTTLRELFDRRKGTIEEIGAASDYAAFQDIAGTSSLDIRFEGEGYPWGSSYDNFDWMDRFGDPGFVYHTLLGQVLGLLVVELADRPILPFDMDAYANSLNRWVNDLEAWGNEQGSKEGRRNNEGGRDDPGSGKKNPFDVASLRAATNEVTAAVKEFDKWELTWEGSVVAASGWEPAGLGRQRCEYNDRMARFETDLLDAGPGGGVRHSLTHTYLLSSFLSPFLSLVLGGLANTHTLTGPQPHPVQTRRLRPGPVVPARALPFPGYPRHRFNGRLGSR